MFGFKKIRGKENREENWKERKKKKKKKDSNLINYFYIFF